MYNQYLPAAGPGDDEDEDGRLRPIDDIEHPYAAEDRAIAEGDGALTE